MAPRQKIGELLLAAGAINETDLRVALAHQKGPGRGMKLGEVLMAQGLTTSEEVAKALAIQFEVPFVRLPQIPGDVSAILSSDYQAEHRIIPFKIEKDGRTDVVHVAIDDPAQLDQVDELRFEMHKSIRVHMASTEDIESTLSALRGELAELAIEEEDEADDDDLDVDVTEPGFRVADAPAPSAQAPKAASVEMPLEWDLPPAAPSVVVETAGLRAEPSRPAPAPVPAKKVANEVKEIAKTPANGTPLGDGIDLDALWPGKPPEHDPLDDTIESALNDFDHPKAPAPKPAETDWFGNDTQLQVRAAAAAPVDTAPKSLTPAKPMRPVIDAVFKVSAPDPQKTPPPAMPFKPIELTTVKVLALTEPLKSPVPPKPVDVAKFVAPAEPLKSPVPPVPPKPIEVAKILAPAEPLKSPVPPKPIEVAQFVAPAEPLKSPVPPKPVDVAQFVAPTEPLKSPVPPKPVEVAQFVAPTEPLKSPVPPKPVEVAQVVAPTEPLKSPVPPKPVEVAQAVAPSEPLKSPSPPEPVQPAPVVMPPVEPPNSAAPSQAPAELAALAPVEAETVALATSSAAVADAKTRGTPAAAAVVANSETPAPEPTGGISRPVDAVTGDLPVAPSATGAVSDSSVPPSPSDAAGSGKGRLDFSEDDLRMLDNLDRMAHGQPALPAVERVTPGRMVATLIRLLVQKGLIDESEFLEELAKR